MIKREQVTKNKMSITEVGILLLLLLFPLVKCNLGVDLADTGYSLGNYAYPGTVQDMWFLSTYLSNVVGMVLTGLPFGSSMIGMRIYTGLLVSLMAVSGYLFCTRKLKFSRLLTALGEMTAIGLCWCPTVILYNYLTYLFLIWAMMSLYVALTEDKDFFLVLAGALLGCNIMVRLPNVLESGFVLALFYYGFRRRWSLSVWLRKTGLCIAGCISSYLFWLVTILVVRGSGAYWSMLQSLMGVSSSADGYSLMDMLGAMAQAYWGRGYYFEKLFMLMAAGAVWEIAARRLGLWGSKLVRQISFLSFGMISAAMLYVLFNNNLFQLNYNSDSAFIVLSAVFLGFTIMLCLRSLGELLRPISISTGEFLKDGVIQKEKLEAHLKSRALDQFEKQESERLWALLIVLQILILPFGSNNNIYPVVNCMFLIMPFALQELWENLRRREQLRLLLLPLVGIAVCLVIQSVGTGFGYVFGDGKDGQILDTEVRNLSVLQGTRTDAAKAKELEAAYVFLQKEMQGEEAIEILLYGDVPGLSYYWGIPSAISTTWPDLQSYDEEVFIAELNRLEQSGVRPIVGINPQFVSVNRRKEEALLEFMKAGEYREVFRGEDFVLYH